MLNRFAAVSAWLLLALIAFVTLSPLDMRPQTGHALLERFVAYLALGASFQIGYPRRLSWVVAMVIFAAIGLEAAQLLAPGRHAHIVDAAQKLAGGSAGVAIAASTMVLLRRFQAPATSATTSLTMPSEEAPDQTRVPQAIATLFRFPRR